MFVYTQNRIEQKRNDRKKMMVHKETMRQRAQIVLRFGYSVQKYYVWCLDIGQGLRMYEYEDCVNSEVWVMAMKRKLILSQRPLTFEKKNGTR